MFDFLFKLKHQKPCEIIQRTEAQQKEIESTNNKTVIPEKIIAEIDYEKLADAIVKANLESDKQIKEQEKSKNDATANITYSTMLFCTRALLFLLAETLRLISGAFACLFFDVGTNTDAYKGNLFIALLIILCFTVALFAQKINKELKTIKSKSEIVTLFGAIVTFMSLLVAVMGTTIQTIIKTCFNTLLNNNLLVCIIIFIIFITILEKLSLKTILKTIKTNFIFKKESNVNETNEK